MDVLDEHVAAPDQTDRVRAALIAVAADAKLAALTINGSPATDRHVAKVLAGDQALFYIGVGIGADFDDVLGIIPRIGIPKSVLPAVR